jgi:hypothetical protein
MNVECVRLKFHCLSIFPILPLGQTCICFKCISIEFHLAAGWASWPLQGTHHTWRRSIAYSVHPSNISLLLEFSLSAASYRVEQGVLGTVISIVFQSSLLVTRVAINHKWQVSAKLSGGESGAANGPDRLAFFPIYKKVYIYQYLNLELKFLWSCNLFTWIISEPMNTYWGTCITESHFVLDATYILGGFLRECVEVSEPRVNNSAFSLVLFLYLQAHSHWWTLQHALVQKQAAWRERLWMRNTRGEFALWKRVIANSMFVYLHVLSEWENLLLVTCQVLCFIRPHLGQRSTARVWSLSCYIARKANEVQY